MLPLGVRYTWRTEDGSVAAMAFEPVGYAFGWALTAFVALWEAMLVLVARSTAGRRRRSAILYVVATLVTPPLGLLLAAVRGPARR